MTAGRIGDDIYEWAIGAIQAPTTENSPFFAGCSSSADIALVLEHARWIIDRVKDGTLVLPDISEKISS